eukprot:g5507.t1
MYTLSMMNPQKWTVAKLSDKFGIDRERTRAILRLQRNAKQQPFDILRLDRNMPLTDEEMDIPNNMAALDSEISKLNEEIAGYEHGLDETKWNDETFVPDEDFMSQIEDMKSLLGKLDQDNDKLLDFMKPSDDFLAQLDKMNKAGIDTDDLNFDIGKLNSKESGFSIESMMKDEPWAKDLLQKLNEKENEEGEKMKDEKETIVPISDFLRDNGLGQYTSAFEQISIFTAGQLSVMKNVDLSSICTDVGMDDGSRKIFLNSMNELREKLNDSENVNDLDIPSLNAAIEELGGEEALQNLDAEDINLSDEGAKEFKRLGLATEDEMKEVADDMMKAVLKPLGGIDGHAYKGQFGMNFYENEYEDKWFGKEDELELNATTDDFETAKNKLLNASAEDEINIEKSRQEMDDFYKYFRPTREFFKRSEDYELYSEAENRLENDPNDVEAREVQQGLLQRELEETDRNANSNSMENYMREYFQKEREIDNGERQSAFDHFVQKRGKASTDDASDANDFDFDDSWRGHNPEHVYFHNQSADGTNADFMTAGLEDYFNRGTAKGKEAEVLNPLTPELVTIKDNETVEEVTARLEKERQNSQKVMPPKRIAATQIDPNFNRQKGAKHQFKIFFQDISETGRTADRKKCLGVLDHDGTFRPPTEQELYFRRWQPSRQKEKREDEKLQEKLDEEIIDPATLRKNVFEEAEEPSEQELYWKRFPHRDPRRYKRKLEKEREARREVTIRHTAREKAFA